jgi:hypothetical protein
MGGKGIDIPLIPKLAKGSDFSPDTFIAGEQGPELIAGAKGRKVFAASKTDGMIGAINEAVKIAADIAGAAKDVISKARLPDTARQPQEIKADVTVNAPRQSDNGVVEAVKNIGGLISNAAKDVISKVQLPDTAQQPQETKANITAVPWQSDNGIIEAVKNIGGLISGAAKFVAEKFSQVKETADDTGITDAVRSFGADIAALAKSSAASPGTVQSMISPVTNRSVTQNVNFSNTFNGGERAAQKRASEAMGKNAQDATGQLARALAYVR